MTDNSIRKLSGSVNHGLLGKAYAPTFKAIGVIMVIVVVFIVWRSL